MAKLADVIPFRGLRYNRALIPDLSKVVSPPYDIISRAGQEHYHQKHPQNAVHLDFALEHPGDDYTDNRYTRAAAALSNWLENKILLPEPEPALYLSREEFEGPDGSPAVREGFIAAVRLAEFSEGIILPHEETSSGPKQDRLRLMEATEANLSPIYCLFSDPGHKISAVMQEAASREADFSLTDQAGTRHSLWVVRDPAVISFVTEHLSDKTLLIADGHHRYETALAYRDARRKQENPKTDQPYDYLMVYLSNMEDSEQAILPIHRLVYGLSSETLSGILSLLDNDFTVEEVLPAADDRGQIMVEQVSAAGKKQNAFGLYLPGTGSYYVLVARRPRPMLNANTGHSQAWRSLEVSVLDKLVLEDLLGISPHGPNAGATIKFVERTGNALSEAKNCDAAFFVNPTSMREIKAVAEAGEKMPQKSTYFHPKPLTGLVFRSFRY